MQKMEAEVDELDAELDDQLSDLLKPEFALGGLDKDLNLITSNKPKSIKDSIKEESDDDDDD